MKDSIYEQKPNQIQLHIKLAIDYFIIGKIYLILISKFCCVKKLHIFVFVIEFFSLFCNIFVNNYELNYFFFFLDEFKFQ